METYQKLRINGSTEYDCYFTDNFNHDYFTAILKTDNSASLEQEFNKIEKLEIIDLNGLVRDMTTRFTTLDSYKLILRTYTDADGNFVRAYEIRLIPTNLEDQVKRLEEKVNPIINESAMTLDDFKAYKIKQLGEACTKAIYAGTEVETSKGLQNFSYSLEDQSNLKDIFASATATNLPCPYHPNSEICTIYPAYDIIKIYLTLSGHKLYHTTYVNALNTYIRSLYDKTAISKVTYGQDVPAEYKENMDEILAQGQLAIDTILSGSIPSAPDPQPEVPGIPEQPDTPPAIPKDSDTTNGDAYADDK